MLLHNLFQLFRFSLYSFFTKNFLLLSQLCKYTFFFFSIEKKSFIFCTLSCVYLRVYVGVGAHVAHTQYLRLHRVQIQIAQQRHCTARGFQLAVHQL